jgi:Tol biopolymer transport system component/DNA-binding winged helix-turn-helix (wHTH) protein
MEPVCSEKEELMHRTQKIRAGWEFMRAVGPDSATTFRLHEWTVRPDLNRIEGPRESHQVEPRVMQVLVYLAARPGQVVSRNELLSEVWQDVIVGDEALTRTISELRRIFEDDARVPRVVETIRKGGYRLVAPVAPLAAQRASRRNAWVWVAWTLVVLGGAWAVRELRPGGGAAPDAVTAVRAIPFTSFPGEEVTPAMSPDGTQVAFAWRGPDDGNMDIYVKQTNSETPLRLTDSAGTDVYPAWSPDGSALAFIHADDSGTGIYTVAAIGGAPRKVCDATGWLGGLSWSPDGETIVYSEARNGEFPAALFVLDLATGDSRPLVEAPDQHQGDIAPVYAPDGRSVAFVRVDGAGMQDIHVVSTETGTTRRLTRALLWVRGLDWTRDGKSIICSTFTNGAYGLWRVNAENGRMSWVPTRGEWVFSPSVARHAGRMVYQDKWFEKNIWRVRRDEDDELGLSTAPVISSSRWDCEAYYSPDGNELVFTSARSGHLEIWTCAADGSRPMQLTAFEGAYVGRPRWSPDGARIAFYACPNGFGDLYVVDSDGGSPRAITEGDPNELMADWSRDGKWIYYASDHSGSWQLWKLSMAEPGRDPVQVTRDGGITGYESVDARFLYFARPDRAGLWRSSLLPESSSDEAELVIEELPRRGDWGNWSVFESGIVLVRYDKEGPEIVLYDFASGGIESVTRIPNIAAPSLAVSPDGRSILYARVEKSVGDLMLVDGFE